MKSEVLCVNDGIIFANAAAAARYYNILPSVLSQHLNGKIKTAAGLAFARVPAESSPADQPRRSGRDPPPGAAQRVQHY